MSAQTTNGAAPNQNASQETAVQLAADSIRTDSLAIDTLQQALPWPQNVQARLKQMEDDALLQHSQLGLMVYDLTADSALYCYGERQTLRPASTMKLLTAITALDRLGGDYQFRTSLYYTGSIADGTLNGNLYCVGGMDPRFNNDDLKAFVESIKKMGVDSIGGRLMIDLTMKDENMFGEGWCWDDDNPVLTPLLIGKKDEFAQRFIGEMRDEGIAISDTISQDALPNGAYIVCSRFHSLDQVLMRMMKESDNLYAESMFYQLAAAGGQRKGSAANARHHIKRLIGKLGLQNDDYKIADGSGLSLYNYVTPELLVRLLRYAFLNPDIFTHLYPALPVAGKDGTLEDRMKDPFTSGNVHAKTGTVTGVASLAGYCTAANGHQLCFAIINQGVLRASRGRKFQDQVCTALCQP